MFVFRNETPFQYIHILKKKYCFLVASSKVAFVVLICSYFFVSALVMISRKCVLFLLCCRAQYDLAL